MFAELIARVAGTLEQWGLPYMIIGGQAVLLYGVPRLTKDIDITLGIDTTGLDKVVEAVKAMDLEIIPGDFRSFVQKTYVLPTRDPKSGIRVDFIFSYTPYEIQAIARANRVELMKTAIMFASVEDVIVHKLFAGRPRDLEDVRSILIKTPKLDREYVRRWLAEFERSSERPGLVKTFDAMVDNGFQAVR